MIVLDGIAELAAGYDGFIVDIWGVLHDGTAPYPRALSCLARMRPKPVLLLSNAPRRQDAARSALRGLGVKDGLYSDLLTSGEATWQALRTRREPWFAALGSRVYHLGPARDRGVLEGVGLSRVDDPAQGDFVLNTGPDENRDGARIEAFTPELDACLSRSMPMICANPDLEIVRGSARILCAGALAAYYASKGGDVRLVGKPDPAIFRQALRLMGLATGRVLVIGDSLRTDIAGAAAAGLDAVWVLGGLHANALAQNHQAAHALAMEAGLSPVAAISHLAW